VTSYRLGVDLGTTFTAAAILDDSGIPAVVGLGNRAMQIPSVLHIGADGTVALGEQAERQAIDDPSRVVREFKRRMGDRVPIYVAGRPFPAAVLMARLLRWVVEQTGERMGGPPTRVTLTHPAAWTDFTIGRLRAAAELAGLAEVDMCPEPVAAAMQYARTAHVQVGDRICVYDLGGGTFDVCIMVRTADSFDILGAPTGIDPMGGIDFDKQVIARVHRELFSAHPALDPEDPGYLSLRRECLEAKEALSRDVETVIPVALRGLTTSLRLTRAELESKITEAIDATVAMTHRALRSAGLAAADLTAIVLVGGSSRIPLVSERLTSAFRCPIALDTHPKHVVALGAALVGSPAATGRPVTIGPAAPQAASGVDLSARAPAPLRPRPPRQSQRSSQRWRRHAMAAAGIAAAITSIMVARAWLAPADSPTAGASGPISNVAATTGFSTPNGTAPGSIAVGTAAGSASSAPRSSSPTPSDPSTVDLPSSTASTRSVAPSSAAVSSAAVPFAAVPSAAEPSGAGGSADHDDPSAAPPGSFDAQTVVWFHTLCRGGSQLADETLVPGQRYPNLKAAQQAYVDSYSTQAATAIAIADALAAQAPTTIAGGRIDFATVVDGFRALSRALTGASDTVAAADPHSSDELDATVHAVAIQVDPDNRPADLAPLTNDEIAFVGSLPGCESLLLPG